MRTSLVIAFVSAAGALNASAPAAAEDYNWYAGAGFGRADHRLSSGQLSSAEELAGVTPTLISITDQTDNGSKFFGGYRFNRNIALEAGYHDLGRSRWDITASNPAGTGAGKARITSWSLSLVGSMPINDKLSVLGKIGMNRWKVESTFPINAGALVDQSFAHTSRGLLLGIGGQYDFNERLSVRAEYEWFGKVGSRDATGEADMNMYSLSGMVHF